MNLVQNKTFSIPNSIATVSIIVHLAVKLYQHFNEFSISLLSQIVWFACDNANPFLSLQGSVSDDEKQLSTPQIKRQS